MKQMSVEANYV